MIRLQKGEEAAGYFNTCRKALEPIPGCQWAERHEWHCLRRDLYKNLAIFFQSQEEWQKAFDNLRIAITHEKKVGDNTAETSLTCGQLLAKMNRFAESIEFAQESCIQIERALGILPSKPLQEFRYNGKSRDIMEQRDKQFTHYAIANHLIGKSLLNLQYFKEARYFLTKASTAVTKCLNVPKRELQVTISNDIAKLTQVSRGNLKQMTDEQVQGSLVTIKTDLATRAMSGIGGDRIEQRKVLKQMEEQLEEEKKDQEKTLKTVKINEEAPDESKVVTIRARQSEERKLLVHAEQESKIAAPEPDKRQRRVVSEQPQGNQPAKESVKKQKKEKDDDPEFLKVDKYPSIATKLMKAGAIQYQSSREKRKAEAALKIDGKTTAKRLSESSPAGDAEDGQAAVRRKRRQKSHNVKTQRMNLAKDGSEQDPNGLKYSEERSIKSYLRARKEQIRSLNKQLGYEESDQSLGDQEQMPILKDRKAEDDLSQSPVRLPPLVKKPEVKQTIAKAVNTGISTEQLAQIQNRREFKPKQQARGEGDPRAAQDSTLKLLTAIEKGMTIKSEPKTPTPEPSNKSLDSYDNDVADELAVKLQKEVIKSEVEIDFQNDLFQQDLGQESPREKADPVPFKQTETPPYGADDYVTKGNKNSRLPSHNKSKSPDEPKKLQKNKQNKSEPNLKAAKTDSGLKPKRQFGQPIEELSTLKRQGTPPLKEEREKEKLQKLKEKHAARNSSRQPDQKPKVVESPKTNNKDKLQRESLIYALMKEKRLNVGNYGNFDKETTTVNKERKASNVATEKKDVEGKTIINQFRLNQLSQPKKLAEKKDPTDSDLQRQNERQAEKQIEIQKKKQKFDFAEYVNRDAGDGQQLSNRPDFNMQYKPMDAMQRKREQRRLRELEEPFKNSPIRSPDQPSGKQPIEDDTFVRAFDETNQSPNLANIIRKASKPNDASNRSGKQLSSNDGSVAPANIITNQERTKTLASHRISEPVTPIGRVKHQRNGSDMIQSPFDGASAQRLRSGLPPSSNADLQRQTTSKEDYTRVKSNLLSGVPKAPPSNRASENEIAYQDQPLAALLQQNIDKKYQAKPKVPQTPQAQASSQNINGRKGKAPTLGKVKQKSTKNVRNPYTSYVADSVANLEHDSEVVADRNLRAQLTSLQQLRRLEHERAILIQSMIRQFMTRKWYMNLQIRKRLSVPYSGLDFAQNPFLRQFARVNQRMQVGSAIQAEVINIQKADRRRNLVQVKSVQKQQPQKIDTLGQKRQREQDKEFEPVPIIIPEKTQPTRKIGRGATPTELLHQLKNEFIEKGLDAYEQFKKLGAGVDFNADGQAFAEGGIQKVRKLIEEQRIAKLEFIGEKNYLAKEERPDIDPQLLEPQETKEYLRTVEIRKGAVKKQSDAAQNTTGNIRFIVNNMDKGDKKPLPLDQYQQFSREPIVFYKNMGYADQQVKWTIFAADAFSPDGQKMYIPVKIIGKPMKARSTIISYTMNLELMNIPREATKKYDFESIWPFILYLFNNWVKHQVTLMGIKRILPGMQDRLPDSNYTIFECHNDLRADFDALEDEAYKDMLNFSSELEIDERFDSESLHKPAPLEKSRPEGIRKTQKENAQLKRKKLFDEYKNSVAKAIDMQEKQLEMQKGRRFVQFAEQLVENLTVEEQLNLLGDNKLAEQSFPMNQKDIDAFRQFLGDHYVRLPKPRSNQIKLMSAMAQSVYWLMEKRGGLPSMQIALMNEERRRIKQLPSLTQLDYNCIDRAAIKLRLILDCLQIERRTSGKALVPRNLKQQQKIYQYSQTVAGYITFCSKRSTISISLLKLIGKIITYQQAFDGLTTAVKIQAAPSSQIVSKPPVPRKAPIKFQSFEDEMDAEILGNQDSFKSSQIGINLIQPKNKGGQENQELVLSQQSMGLGDEMMGGFDPVAMDYAAQQNAINENEKKQRMFLEKNEIETVVLDDSVLEQGTIRFSGLVYMATLVFRTIHCNFDNMTILHQIKEQKYQKESKKYPLAKDHDVQERASDLKNARHKQKPCTFASSHPTVAAQDQDFLVQNKIQGNKLLDLQMYLSNLQWTVYQSYLEVRVCPRLSSTLWMDSVLVTWEQLGLFFEFFGIKDWEPTSFLKNERFSQAESLLFYEFFSECLAVDEEDNVTLTFNLARLNPIRHRYEAIFLDLHRYEWTQRSQNINFFLPDVLLQTKFDKCSFDELVYPYYQDPALIPQRLIQLEANMLPGTYGKDDLEWNLNPQQPHDWVYGKLTNRLISNKLAISADFIEGTKPDILVEESTVAYLKDPGSLFNLTLSSFPKAQTLFLGSLELKPVKSEFKAPLVLTSATKRSKAIQVTPEFTKYNVRIDYFVIGVLPCLQIRAFTRLAAQGGSASLVLNTVTHNQKLIKDIIRICGQTSQHMVYNQLESLFSIEETIPGRKLHINHTLTTVRRTNSALQDIYSMLILNEQILAQRLGPHNCHKHKGLINLRNVSTGMSSVLASVSQYDIQQELLLQHGDLMLDLIHGNKHITKQMIARTRELILQKTLELNPDTNLKEFKPLSVWRITILDMRKSDKYDAILTHDDLTYYFQSEVFKFFRENPHLGMPDILTLLTEYILNLYAIRTPVGRTLAWNLPTYKPVLDKNGIHVEVQPDQLFKMPLLDVYKYFQNIREEQNAFSDQNKLPISLDAQKKQRLNGKIPKLCLRTRLAIEKILPVYEVQDLRSLKYSSREYRIITQVTKLFKSISEFHFAIVTVTQHEAIEGWIWTIYFPITQRNFTISFFQSDLIALDSKIFQNIAEDKAGEVALWTKIVNETELLPNMMGDIVLRVDSFSESIKELLYQTYVYNERSKDLYFMEVTFKSFSNYVTEMKKAFPCIDLNDEKQSKDYTISLRAYSMAKEQWIKDYQPLGEVISMLKQDGIQWTSQETDENQRIHSKSIGVDPQLLMEVSKNTTNFYYSMIRNAAVLMANKIQFADKPKQAQEVRKRKMTYDLQQILKAKKEQAGQKNLRSDFTNLVLLNRIIYQATVAQNPIQVCSISYNESKDRFVYRLYRPFNGCESIERRFDGSEIQKTCCPHYLTMLQNGMDRELGQRIAKFYHANILVASVLEINNLQGLVDAYPELSSVMVGP